MSDAPVLFHPIRAIEPLFIEKHPEVQKVIDQLTFYGITFLSPNNDGDLHEEAVECALLTLEAIRRIDDLELVNFRETQDLAIYNGRPIIGNVPPQINHYLISMPDYEPIDHYGLTETFMAHAGRRTMVVTWDMDEGWVDTDVEALKAWADSAPLFIKNHTGKGPVTQVDGFEDLVDSIPQLNLHAHRVTALVQDYTPMYGEIRTMVVGGEVISYTPRASWLTPYNRNDKVLKSITTSDHQDLIFNPVQAEKLVDFARTVALEFMDETGWGFFSLDVAFSQKDDSPLVVELNNLNQSGLFATNVLALVDALATTPRPLPRVKVMDLFTLAKPAF